MQIFTQGRNIWNWICSLRENIIEKSIKVYCIPVQDEYPRIYLHTDSVNSLTNCVLDQLLWTNPHTQILSTTIFSHFLTLFLSWFLTGTFSPSLSVSHTHTHKSIKFRNLTKGNKLFDTISHILMPTKCSAQ